MIVNKYELTSGRAAGFTSPKFVVVSADFVGGQETIEACDVGLTSIIGFFGGTWGNVSGVGSYIDSTSTLADSGVTSIDLERIDEAGALQAGVSTVTLIGI